MDASVRRTLANDWLKDFSLALKNVSLYSVDHPRGREYLDRAYESLQRLLVERREILLTRSEGRLNLDGILLDRDRGLGQQLSEDLAARNVESLLLKSTVTPQEHHGLIRALMMKPERVVEKGGFGQLLIDEGVASIVANTALQPQPAGEVNLVDFLLHQVRWSGSSHGTGFEAHSHAEGSQNVTSILNGDPAGLSRAIESLARKREPAVTTPEALAELLADTLERLAERAIEEHFRDREEILAAVGRAVVGAEPYLHSSLFLEKGGPRSIRKNLAAAVESLAPEQLAELVAIHYPRARGDYRRLSDLLARTLKWRDDRVASLRAVETKMREFGLDASQIKELIDHLAWNEVALERRLELLNRGDLLWRVDFGRVKEVLVKLLATGHGKEGTALIQKYLGGLMGDDLEVRRRVADNARYILQLVEKTDKGLQILDRIADLFVTRFQDEQDADVVARLAGGLAYLADMRLRAGNLAAALDLMRKAEQLSGSKVPAHKERGERLAEALERAGNDKIFKTLTEMLLGGNDQSSMEAAEILKRGGARSSNYLIERLAEEENRSHRARLVMLLKEMGKGSSMSFASRLEDPRWFLVRNVVGILGDIGDVAILPQLRRVAAHGDPRVRREVVRTLMRFGTSECEEMIIAAIADDDRGVQITAVNALASLKGPRALGVLIDLARKTGPFENAPVEVRQEGIVGLGRLGAREAIPILTAIVSKKGFLGHAEPTELRASAARALGSMPTPETTALLKELAQKDPRQPVREAAQEALQQKTTSAGLAESRR